MITPFMFWALAAIGGVLTLYVFVDSENRIMGHIFAAIVATVLFFLLGVTIITGNVGDVHAVASNQTTINATLEYAYSTVSVPVQDTAIGYLFIFMGVFMLIVTVLAGLEIVSEMMDAKNRAWRYDNEF